MVAVKRAWNRDLQPFNDLKDVSLGIPKSNLLGSMFQNQASDATFQNLPPDAIFCDHASDVYHEWHSVPLRTSLMLWYVLTNLGKI